MIKEVLYSFALFIPFDFSEDQIKQRLQQSTVIDSAVKIYLLDYDEESLLDHIESAGDIDMDTYIKEVQNNLAIRNLL